MFESELAFFIANQAYLVSKHRGQTLLLTGEKVAGVYATPLEAYLAAQNALAPGSFMIQPCEPGPDAYTVTVTSSEVLG